MKEKIIVVAPHADDETLGCAGTLLRHKSEGQDIHWLLVTDIPEQYKVSVQNFYGFSSAQVLDLPSTQLETVGLAHLVDKISKVFSDLQPTTVYLPYGGDIHSDHKVVFDAAAACTKWFRHPTIKRILVYETPSETDFALNPDLNHFRPNVFVDISLFLEKKLNAMKIYKDEMGQFPFPRSKEAIMALAQLRGAACGVRAAEAFMLLKEII